MPSLHWLIQKLENKCCNNSFPISIKFGNQLGHHVPQGMIRKNRLFSESQQKHMENNFWCPQSASWPCKEWGQWLVTCKIHPLSACHIAFQTVVGLLFPTDAEKIIIPMKMKNPRWVTGLIERMPTLLSDFVLYSLIISSFIWASCCLQSPGQRSRKSSKNG
jgi:hypothetical protein